MKIVILYSSGLDSRIMLHMAKVMYPDAEVKCVYYAHGADSEAEEIARLPDFVEVRRIDWLGDNIKPVAKKEDPFAGAIYIPGRNLVLSALAACQELANEVWMGTLWDEDNPKGTDKNEHFRNSTSELLSYVLSPFVDGVKVVFPFVDRGFSKQHSVAWAIENGLPREEILNTVSCWHHKGKPCGRCKQCFKRQLVLRINGMSEECVLDPLDSDFGQELTRGYMDAVYVNGSDNRDEKNVASMLLACMLLNRLPKSLTTILEQYNV